MGAIESLIEPRHLNCNTAMDFNGKSILALETSTELASASLSHQGLVRSQQSDAPRSHAKILLPMVDALLAERDLEIADLDLVLVSLGPGAFTGIRIGISIAQGLAYGAGISLAGLSSLDILIKMCLDDSKDYGTVVPALDARMNEVYWSAYNAGPESLTALSAPCVSSYSHLQEFVHEHARSSLVGVGQGWKLSALEDLPDIDKQPARQPHAESMLACLHDTRFLPKLVAPRDIVGLEPLYLRNEVTWEKRVRIRSRQAPRP